MGRSLWCKGAACTTEHNHQLADYWIGDASTGGDDGDNDDDNADKHKTMMKKMIWVITPIAISTKPISALNRLKSRVGRASICSISQSMEFTHHYWLSPTGAGRGLICMLWYCISSMISGFTAHLRAHGWWEINQRSSMWCACQDNINFYSTPCH